MTIYKTIRCLILLAGFAALSQTAAFAQGQVVNDNTTTANLEMTAEAQTVLNLDIATDGGAAVTGTSLSGDFAIDLGNVNGFGVGAPLTGVTATASTGGYIYTTPIKLVPTFSGFSSEDVTIEVSNDGDATAREGADIASVDDLSASLVEINTTASTGDEIHRVVGFFVSNANGSGHVSGEMRSTITYTITATP
jgi:hypothetical protein